MDQIDFQFIASQAQKHTLEFLNDWLPGGRVSGCEYSALNPLREDKHPGSFKINIQTGRWADFATSDRGTDLISLYALLNNITQSHAARIIANKIGLDLAAICKQGRAKCR